MSQPLARRRFLVASAAALCTVGTARPALGEVVSSRVSEIGLVGELHIAEEAPAKTSVIMLNGSDGGIPPSALARDLAAAGFPTLALAYLRDGAGEPAGVPPVGPFPLETVFRALEWMRARPGLSSIPIVLMGLSRGAELALLTASLRPDVAGVAAFSPGRHVWGTVGRPRDYQWDRSAWSLGGEPLPWRNWAPDLRRPSRDWFLNAPERSGTEIEVEAINGPLLLVSSRADLVWPAATYADEIVARLQSRNFIHPVENLQFDDASHLLMGFGPGVTEMSFPGTSYVARFGGSLPGTLRARNLGWAAKSFLLNVGRLAPTS